MCVSTCKRTCKGAQKAQIFMKQETEGRRVPNLEQVLGSSTEHLPPGSLTGLAATGPKTPAAQRTFRDQLALQHPEPEAA